MYSSSLSAASQSSQNAQCLLVYWALWQLSCSNASLASPQCAVHIQSSWTLHNPDCSSTVQLCIWAAQKSIWRVWEQSASFAFERSFYALIAHLTSCDNRRAHNTVHGPTTLYTQHCTCNTVHITLYKYTQHCTCTHNTVHTTLYSVHIHATLYTQHCTVYLLLKNIECLWRVEYLSHVFYVFFIHV